MRRTILLTGVTGFLGKVVLEELLRSHDKLSDDRVILLIRPAEDVTAEQRFFNEVAKSLCFSRLPRTWVDHVDVVSSDLRSKQCGIEDSVYQYLRLNVTHIIHCAGSVAFSPSAAEDLLLDNITSSLNMLELARSCAQLSRFVYTSTAYVSPHTHTPIQERLPQLPDTASALYSALQEGHLSVEGVMRSTGHPNLYTLSKCLAEHLLMETKGAVPLTIVRPSIISASWKYPFPGWIDSFAAVAGIIAGFGSGTIRVFNGSPDTVQDIVPVDIVAKRIIDEAVDDRGPARITHVVSGRQRGIKIGFAQTLVPNYFRRHPVFRKPAIHFIGKSTSLRYRLNRALHHQIPWTLQKQFARLSRDERKVKSIDKIMKIEQSANSVFEPFTHRTYDFRADTNSLDEDYSPDEYFHRICHGVRVYLLQRDPQNALFAGKQSKGRGNAGTLRWSRHQPDPSLVTGVAAAILRKTFTRVFDKINFNEQSFLEAMEGAQEEKSIVIVPTHRSYLDSLVCLYLLFTRPELGIKLPRVIASEEFSHIPVVGWLCRRFKTIFVVRGGGKPDPQLDVQLENVVENHDNVLFYVEGQRSRDGKVLPGKRGVLRSLQSTQSDFLVLPVSISYDRVPEASAFAAEIKGGPKQVANVRGLVKWTINMARGRVHLGDCFVQCGQPLTLHPDTDVHHFVAQITTALEDMSVAPGSGTTLTQAHHVEQKA